MKMRNLVSRGNPVVTVVKGLPSTFLILWGFLALGLTLTVPSALADRAADASKCPHFLEGHPWGEADVGATTAGGDSIEDDPLQVRPGQGARGGSRHARADSSQTSGVATDTSFDDVGGAWGDF